MDIGRCIEMCTECHRACLETLADALLQEQCAETEQARLLLDCAQACAVAADFMARRSEFHGLTCATCAAVSERCAVACDEAGNEASAHCADVCRRCAVSCRQVAQATQAV